MGKTAKIKTINSDKVFGKMPRANANPKRR